MASTVIPIPTVDATGYHLPAFSDLQAGLRAAYEAIYGTQDWDNSDQDTQWVGIQAAALNDTFALGLSVYNSFSPTTAQGTGLSSVVKVNGITREVSTYSTVTVTVIAQPQTYTGLKVGDGTYAWDLPASITIPSSGTLDVLATCETAGAITAQAGDVDQLLTPTLGLQSISNAAAATPGAPVETDAMLRVRQSHSTMLPATGVVDGIYGALANLPSVARVAVYENDQATTDVNGIPGHTISAVVDGGDPTAIAQAIATRKLSAGTYGTASAVVTTGSAQIPRTIFFFRPLEPSIIWSVSVRPLTGFTADGTAAIQQAISDWTNALGIGVQTATGKLYRVPISRAYAPALLTGTVYDGTFEIVAGSLLAARSGGTLSATDPVIAFNEAPSCSPSFVAVTVLSS